jgi:oligosaccharyltransferase complex subunit epsilon
MAVPKPPAKTVDTSAAALQSSVSTLVQNYRATTLTRTKLIDCFLLVLVVSGVLQFAYRILITGYPFNAFLGR